eukprot:1137322-Pelagomonas_calceolata.AAC.3
MSERTCAYFCALRLNKRQTSPTPAGAKRTEFDIKRLLAHRLKPEAKASPESPRFNFCKGSSNQSMFERKPLGLCADGADTEDGANSMLETDTTHRNSPL